MTAFITGASSGFGAAVARAFAKNNFKVIAAARRLDRLEALKADFDEQIHILKLDVRDKEAVFNAVSNLPDNFKNVDILFNNAGLALGLGDFDELSLDDIESMVDTNVKGFLYVARALIPIMRKQKNAYIFNLGSVAGRYPYAGGNVYCGTKAFVRQFSLALRNDLRGSNIKVTNIAPGLCKTEFSEVRFKGDKQKADAVYENTKFISAENMATLMMSLINLPSHININEIELMPVTQSFAGLYVEKNS